MERKVKKEHTHLNYYSEAKTSAEVGKDSRIELKSQSMLVMASGTEFSFLLAPNMSETRQVRLGLVHDKLVRPTGGGDAGRRERVERTHGVRLGVLHSWVQKMNN